MTPPNNAPHPPGPETPAAAGRPPARPEPESAVRPAFELPPVLWAGDLQTALPPMAWLWQGYLAPGSITLLTSQWKSGKTTLLAVLLARMKTGGSLGGLAVAPGKALVICEEGRQHWELRRQKLDFGGHVAWLCRPFRGRPGRDQWLALVDHVAALHARHGFQLVVLDPLSYFLPGGAEGHAGKMLETLLPLQRWTASNLAVFLLHHPRKGECPAGQAARGNGALPSFVDINIEMTAYAPADAADRRRLRAASRFEETPVVRVLALTEEGTDYLVLAEGEEEDFGPGWDALEAVLAGARRKLTRQQILEEWHDDLPVPQAKTLWRWLGRAVEQGLVHRSGTGRKNDPYLYWLAGQEMTWRDDPLYQMDEERRQVLRELDLEDLE